LSEYAKRNIAVINFGADGDSRALKAMLKALDMDVLLRQHDRHNNPHLPVFKGKSAIQDDVKDEDESESDSLDPCLAEGTPEDTAVMTTDFSDLRNNGL